MTPLLHLSLLCVLCAVCGFSKAAAEPSKPNILILFSDDQGYADLGVQGANDIPTPHLDSLAANGVRCMSGYVSSSMCSPSRAGLLTGRSQSRFGHEINWPPAWPINPEDTHGLPLTESTIADQLRAVGYRTGIVGKWHLGEAPRFHPNRRGFDEFFGFVSGGKNYFCENLVVDPPARGQVTHSTTALERNGVPQPDLTGYLTTVLGRECADYIARHEDKPWFLYASFNAPHTPLQATPELLERVKDIPDEKRRTYAAMVVALDDAVGEILASLRETGQEERTLIFFLSDNGGPLGDKSATRNTPLRGGKGQMHEGGIRVPFLVQWKGTLPAGTTYDRPISSLDILPTALAAEGGKSIADKPLDGVDLVPYLTGETTGDPHEFLHWRMTARNSWAIRSGDHKLVLQQSREPRLYDLATDIGETSDLSETLPEVRARLQQAYDTWAATLSEPLWGGEAEKSPTPRKAKKP